MDEPRTEQMNWPEDVDQERVWRGIVAQSMASNPGIVERALGAMLPGPALVRAIVTTPSLVFSWVLSSAAVLLLGALLSNGSVSETPWLGLLAPIVCAAGIAYAYGPGVDPAYELTRTMAVSDRAVLLARAMAVFAVNLVLVGLASLLVQPLSPMTIAWLLPMTAVSAIALAVAAVSNSPNLGIAVGGIVWALNIAISSRGTTDFAAVLDPGVLTPIYIVTTIAAVALAYVMADSRGVRRMEWQ